MQSLYLIIKPTPIKKKNRKKTNRSTKILKECQTFFVYVGVPMVQNLCEMLKYEENMIYKKIYILVFFIV